MNKILEQLNNLKDTGYINKAHLNVLSVTLEEHDKEVRTKAITEFAEQIKDFIAKNVEDAESSDDLCCEIFQSEVDEIAMKMKGGMTKGEYCRLKKLHVSFPNFNPNDELTEDFKNAVDSLVDEFSNIYAENEDNEV